MKATIEAKKDRRQNVASTVIALAPEVMTYINKWMNKFAAPYDRRKVENKMLVV